MIVLPANKKINDIEQQMIDFNRHFGNCHQSLQYFNYNFYLFQIGFRKKTVIFY